MTVDYDVPRQTELSDGVDTSVRQLTVGDEGAAELLDIDDIDAAGYLLPDVEVAAGELTMRIVPRQADEFVCASCFLVLHRSIAVDDHGARLICRDCA